MEHYPFDDEYVRRLRGGDRVTEDHFFRFFRERLMMKLRHNVRPPIEAEDLCQRVFIIALRKIEKGEGPEDGRKLAAWMHGICSNVIHEFHREQERRHDQLDVDRDDVPVDPDQYERLLQIRLIKLVRETIAALSPKDAQILTAVFLREEDRDAVCKRFNVDRQYLRVLVHRALQHFKEKFPDDDDDPTNTG
jgi:RNA polymerase sigma-70 factor (ECF subfamily)